MPKRLSLTVNGEKHELEVPANRTLFQLIREDLDLNGTKDACRQGVCGSCTVLVDGTPIRSCLALAVRCHGKHVTTVEGLKGQGKLDRLQQEFINAGAVQCGYCTPGMVLRRRRCSGKHPEPTEAEVARPDRQPVPLYRIHANRPRGDCGKRERGTRVADSPVASS